MRKFTTSLFIALLALLALPEKAWAQEVYLLTAETIKGIAGNYNVPSNHKFESAGGTVYTYTFSNTEASGDIYFRIGVSGWGNNMQPANNNDPLTINGDPYSITYGTSNAWKLTLDNTKYSSYTITVDISESNRYVKVTATNSGGSDPVSTYKLMKGDGANEGSQVATFTGTGFPYTATYNINEAGTYYFYVNDGSKNYFNQNQEITSDGGIATIYQYNDNFFDRVVKLQAPRAGEYTFKFSHVQGTEYTLQCNFPSETETKYTVTVSSADETMGTVSTSSVSVNGTTSATVTATANTGYKFVSWTASEDVTVVNVSSTTTTVTATVTAKANGTLIANFEPTSTGSDPDPDPTPTKNIPGFYLVGDFLHTDKSINYNCRYFKLSDAVAAAARESVEQYSINIPTTLAVNVQVLAINEDGSTALYGPSGELAIN